MTILLNFHFQTASANVGGDIQKRHDDEVRRLKEQINQLKQENSNIKVWIIIIDIFYFTY